MFLKGRERKGAGENGLDITAEKEALQAGPSGGLWRHLLGCGQRTGQSIWQYGILNVGFLELKVPNLETEVHLAR